MVTSILPPFHPSDTHLEIAELDDPGNRPVARPPSMHPSSRSILPSALAGATVGKAYVRLLEKK
jgi:hypothetical protein